MSFTFNASRWILEKEVRYIIPLWGLTPGALCDIKTSANEIILSYKVPTNIIGQYIIQPSKKNPEIAPKKPKEFHDNDPQNTLK
jgi:hypothetical protein